MQKGFFINNRTREIRIQGPIESWRDSYLQLEAELSSMLAMPGDVTIRINSPGGEVFEGFGMFDLIQRAQVRTVGIVEGIAASAAGWLLQACTERRMSPNSYLMLHHVEGCACGTSSDMRETADMSDKLEDRIRSIFQQRSGQPAEVVDGWFDDASARYFDADEALSLGLIDAIEQPAAQPGRTVNGATATFTNQSPKMDLTNMLATALNVEADATKITAHVTSLRNDLAAANDRVKDLEAKLKAHEDAAAAARQARVDAATAAVNKAHTDGLITESQKGSYANLLEGGADPDTVLALLPTAPARSLRNEMVTPSPKPTTAEQPAKPLPYHKQVAANLRAKHGEPPRK